MQIFAKACDIKTNKILDFLADKEIGKTGVFKEPSYSESCENFYETMSR